MLLRRRYPAPIPFHLYRFDSIDAATIAHALQNIYDWKHYVWHYRPIHHNLYFTNIDLTHFHSVVAKLCDLPHLPEHCGYSPPQKHHWDVGSKIHFNCPPGYNKHGSDYATCIDHGVWDAKPPVCKKRKKILNICTFIYF